MSSPTINELRSDVESWLIGHANTSAGLPPLGIKSNTPLGQILLRMCSMQVAVEEDDTSNEERIPRYVARFFDFMEDASLREMAVDPINSLVDQLGTEIGQGFTMLQDMQRTISTMVTTFTQLLMDRLKRNPQVAALLEDRVNLTPTYTALTWEALYSRYTDADIVGHLRNFLHEEDDGRPISRGEIERELSTLQAFMNNQSLRFKVLDISEEARANVRMQLYKQLKLAVTAYRDNDQTGESRSIDELMVLVDQFIDTICLPTRTSASHYPAVGFLVDKVAHMWETNQTMQLALSVMTDIPLHAVVWSTTEEWLDSSELGDGTIAKLRYNLGLLDRILTIQEAIGVWLRTVNFGDTVLYPNGLVHGDNYNTFIHEGGSPELLAFVATRVSPKLPELPQGILLKRLLDNLEQNKADLTKATTESSDQAANTLLKMKIVLAADLLVSVVFPDSYRALADGGSPINESLGSTKPELLTGEELNAYRSRLMSSVDQAMRAGEPLDRIFYTEMFKFKPWHQSFAEVLYAQFGEQYAKSLGEQEDSIDASKLAETRLQVVGHMMLRMLTPGMVLAQK